MNLIKDEDFPWYNEASKLFLSREYLLPNQTLSDRVKIIVDTFSRLTNNKKRADKFLEYFKKGYYSLSTPVWTNYGTERGLPISCFNSHIDDSVASILFSEAEVGMMSKLGGGTSGYFGEVRHRGAKITSNGESSGAVHFMKGFENTVEVISQGKTRRGDFAAYLPISHPDIKEFLTIKSEGSPIQDLSFGVCVDDEWFKSMIDGDEQKREIWAKVLQTRSETGYPYIFFTDTVNNNTVDVYKDKNMKINSSNLCTEILTPSNSEESFVCCLASVNILHYDEWKETDAVEILVYFLDTVMTEFINKAKALDPLEQLFMKRAISFAERHRSLGLGALGWHSYLQSKMIPFESFSAKTINVQIFKHIYDKAYSASFKLAEEFGEPELLKGYNRRNTTLLAIAPTTSSSFILKQVSQSIEPYRTNYYIKDLAKIKYTLKNPYLENLLEEKGLNNIEIWNSILKHGGSVQHLEELSTNEKNVFKTFSEISQKEVIIQASARQKYIDQSQSLNLMIHPSIPIKDVNSLIIEAWKLGIKTLYYQHSVNASQEFSMNILNCVNCE